MRISVSSTSTRTFLLFPALVAVEQCAAGRRPHLSWLPVLAWGYLQYRLAGRYRTRIGGGGPGMSTRPMHLVTSGIFGLTRNPMYLGHQFFLAGLVLVSRSPAAAALFVFHLGWFDARVRRDERRLADQFGLEYERYCRQVPRWL